MACMNVEVGGGGWITRLEASDLLALVGTSRKVPSIVIFENLVYWEGKMRCGACIGKL